MTLWATIMNENTSDLAPLYTTTLRIFRGVGVQGRPSPHPMPSPTRGEGALCMLSAQRQAPDGVTGFSPLSLHGRRHGVRVVGSTPAQIPQEDCSTSTLNSYPSGKCSD